MLTSSKLYVSIVGANGSSGVFDRLNREVYYSVCANLEHYLIQLMKDNHINWNTVVIKVGTSPWIEHVAIQLYLNLFRANPDNCPSLEIYSSLNFKNDTFIGDTGLSLETFHKKFSEKMNFRGTFKSIKMISEAIKTSKCKFKCVSYPEYLSAIATTHFMCSFDFPDRPNLMTQHVLKKVPDDVEIIHFKI